MNRALLLSLLIALVTCAPLAATPLTSIPLPGGFLNVSGTAGSGSNDAYFVVDFSANGGHTYAFDYKFNGATLTAADGLQALAAVGLNTTTENFGTPTQPNLLTTGFAYQSDSAQLATSATQGWEFFQGTYNLGSQSVAWAPATDGVSGIDFGNTTPTQFLTNGEFLGFSINSFDVNFNFSNIPPQLPVAAAASVPEPSTLVLALLTGLGAMTAFRRSKRQAIG